MIYNCKICGREMEKSKMSRTGYLDRSCKSQDDHHFSYRTRDDDIIKMRIRLLDGNISLRLKIHYDLNYSEAWTVAGSNNRIHINSIVVPDFSDLDKLKNKIRTMLVFG